MRIIHSFASGKSDGPDATLVRPSNWNDDHTIPAYANVVSPQDYLLAAGDGTTDATAAIQSAIDACAASGGCVYLPRGIYPISTRLAFRKSNVSMVGAAISGWMFDSTPLLRGSVIKWIGGAGANNAMIDVGPDPGNPASPFIVSGINLSNFSFDWNGNAGIPLYVSSVCNSIFENMVINGAANTAIVTANAYAASTGLAINDHNTFRNIWAVVTGEATGILLDGWMGAGLGYNTTFCTFQQVSITHENGFAFQINYGDDNWFINCSSSRITGGTGGSIWLGGSSDGSNKSAIGNGFMGFHGQGDIRSVGGASPALANFILFTSMDNSHSVIIDEGSQLYYIDLGGYTSGTQPRMRLPGMQTAESIVTPSHNTHVIMLGGSGNTNPFIGAGRMDGGDTTNVLLQHNAPVHLASYALGALPTLNVANDGSIAYCTSLAGGREPVYWDGASLIWRRFSDRTEVS